MQFGPFKYNPGGHTVISQTVEEMLAQARPFQRPAVILLVDTHISAGVGLLGCPAAKLQYVMHDPALVTPLKKGIRNVELIAHWNWLELLLYGCRRVPAVHVLDGKRVVPTSLMQLLVINGSVAFQEEQNVYASVQFMLSPVIQYLFAQATEYPPKKALTRRNAQRTMLMNTR
jgi:hypothetical protein